MGLQPVMDGMLMFRRASDHPLRPFTETECYKYLSKYVELKT